MIIEKVSNKELKAEMKKRGLDMPRILSITFNPDDFNYCEKCSASVDRKGKYRPD